jgi:hypothetical protein
MGVLKKHGVFFMQMLLENWSPYFGVDGVNVFQGVCNSVTHQIQSRYVPHLEGIHYMAHCINLYVKTLFKILIVKHIEDLL